jgi:holliday junction DNA helicase RuvA
MIGKLTGSFGGRAGDGSVLIDVQGVSYAVRTTLSALDLFSSQKGPCEVFTHLAVKEDGLDLYGFPTNDELSFFRLLIGVSGIGPKTALGILNVAEIRTLKHAIATGDVTYLTRVFGVGKKSAERIVVELRDKLAKEGYGGATSGDEGDVLDALLGLGYSAEEARTAVKAASKEGDASDRLRKALQILGS